MLESEQWLQWYGGREWAAGPYNFFNCTGNAFLFQKQSAHWKKFNI